MGESKGQRILVIDDAPEVRQVLRALLESQQYRVHTAETAVEGLQLLNQCSPDLLLLDVDLPDMLGTDVCRQLRGQGQDLPILMLTGHNAVHERTLGLRCGADDYLGKPFSPDELLARVEAQLRREERFAQRSQDLLRQRWERIHHGLKLVQESQQPFLRQPEAHDLRSAVRHLPIGRIGGDFYLVRPGRHLQQTWVVMGDVMGKGVTASLVMSWALSQIHDCLDDSPEPAAVMATLQQVLAPDLSELGLFVALFCGLYQASSGIFDFCTAGCEPPIWFRPRSRHQRLTCHGLPLGVEPQAVYVQRRVHPQPGDQLFLFTDGLQDSVPLDQQATLLRALYRLLLTTQQLNPERRAEMLMQQIQHHGRGQLRLRDDLTFLLLHFGEETFL